MARAVISLPFASLASSIAASFGPYGALKPLVVVTLLLSFTAPYALNLSPKFAFATLGILGSLYLLCGRHWRARAGLRMTKRELLASLGLLGLTYFGAEFAIGTLSVGRGLHYSTEGFTWMWRLSPFFQAFNEEVVLRALLLGSLFWMVSRPALVCVAGGLIFAGLHFLFYKFVFYEPLDLSWLCLFNLALFGAVCNLLYLWSGHIGLGVALHAGWNLVRFSGHFEVSGRRLSEAEAFNLIEGTWVVTALMTLLLLTAIAFVMPARAEQVIQAHRRTLF